MRRLKSLLPKKLRGRSEEADGRDVGLARTGGANHDLIVIAQKIARKIAKANGTVSSPEVWSELWDLAANDDGLKSRLEEADPRWMGVVFVHRQWRRLRWDSKGSHKRPVSVWELQPELNV